LQITTSFFSKDFTCPVHHFPLLKPCGVTSCQYHVSNETSDIHEHKNCLISRLDKTKNGKLTLTEVSQLLDLSLIEAGDVNEKAVIKIKKAFILDKIDKLRVVRFQYLEKHCVSCGQSIHDDLDYDDLVSDLILKPKKFGWCSNQCKSKKPRWQFEIEREFGCNFLDVLAVATKTYDQDTVEKLFAIPDGIMRSLKTQLISLIEDLF